MPRVEHIVIETSGLALPKPLVQAFHWPSIKSRVTVDGVVAVVDGAALADGRVAFDLDALAAQRAADNALDHDDPIEEVFEDQIACADLVVLNKCDLLDQSGMDRASSAMAGALPRAVKVVTVSGGKVDRAGAARPQRRHRRRHREPQDPSRRRTRSRPRRVRQLRRAAARDRRSGGLVEARVAGPPRPRTCCASRDLPPCAASRCGFWCRRSARASRTHYDRPWTRVGTARERALVVIGLEGLDRAAITRMLNG